MAAFAYPAGCGSYNVAPKCQIKGNDFSTVYVGSGIMIKDGKIHFINEAEKEFSKKRFQRAFLKERIIKRISVYFRKRCIMWRYQNKEKDI